MKTTTNIINNSTKNAPATYYYPPRTVEEFLDAVNLEKGDERINTELLLSWPWEKQLEYYRECASRPREQRRTPLEVARGCCCWKLLGAKIYDEAYQLSDRMEPIAVVASKKKKTGSIDPRTINALVHYTPHDIVPNDIAMMNAYSKIVEDKYGVHPRLVIVGNEFDNTVFQAVMAFGRDVSIFANKKD